MRERRADTVQATLLALGLHLLLFAVAFLGMWWTRSTAPTSAAGPVIEAELVDASALSANLQRVLRQRPDALPAPEPEPPPQPAPQETAPPPQPLPEPAPQEAPVPPQPQAQERVPEPDTREQERVSRQAAADRAAAEREQEQRRRQEQIDLTEERERQREAERRQRLTEMERQRQAQLEDIRRQRAQLEREAAEAERKLRQLAAAQEAARADAQASQPSGNEGADNDLRARYAAALQAAILRNWTRPETVPIGQRCRIVIRQIPGGQVVDAQVDPSCPYDELGRRSVEAAVLKAQPLPYAGFERVFERTLTLNFQAQDR
ncbi:MAG: cell envelope integrity protein TolA [Gammaproteobacteria bacterium]|jgi:colicin import membrane protein